MGALGGLMAPHLVARPVPVPEPWRRQRLPVPIGRPVPKLLASQGLARVAAPTFNKYSPVPPASP